MSGLSLRLDGMPAGGFCQQHGPYESTWERTWFSHAQGVLACICPPAHRKTPKMQLSPYRISPFREYFPEFVLSRQKAANYSG